MEKNTRCPLNLFAILEKSLFAFLNALAESVNCSLFLKNVEKHFCTMIYKKNFAEHIENLSQHLSEKFIDYRYRFSTKWFIVSVTVDRYLVLPALTTPLKYPTTPFGVANHRLGTNVLRFKHHPSIGAFSFSLLSRHEVVLSGFFQNLCFSFDLKKLFCTSKIVFKGGALCHALLPFFYFFY